jgi:SAM-dependent methyltransferase
MAHAEAFPPYYPSDARRAFGHDEALRRLAKAARFTAGCRVLHLSCGSGAGAVFLANETGCSVVAVDSDPAMIDQVKERVRSNNLTERVQARVVDYRKLPFPDAEFEGIVTVGAPPLTLEAAAKGLRRLLAPKGRLCLVYPVKVGRQQSPDVVQLWERRMGEALRTPREALEVLERAGFEPQSVETLPDDELQEIYRSVQSHLRSVPEADRVERLKEELSVHAAQAGSVSVTFAQMIGRRKEPGEKPPPSRSDA